MLDLICTLQRLQDKESPLVSWYPNAKASGIRIYTQTTADDRKRLKMQVLEYSKDVHMSNLKGHPWMVIANRLRIDLNPGCNCLRMEILPCRRVQDFYDEMYTSSLHQ